MDCEQLDLYCYEPHKEAAATVLQYRKIYGSAVLVQYGASAWGAVSAVHGRSTYKILQEIQKYKITIYR